MSSALYGRVYEVRVGRPGEEGKRWSGELDETGLKRGHQITFEVELSLKARSNKMRLSIVNLSREEVGFLEQDGLVITLLAGYQSNAAMLFSGDIARRGVTTTHEGTDRITTIEAGASEIALQSTRFDRSYAAKTPIRRVIEDVASEMGVGVGNLDQVDGVDATFGAGAVFFGLAKIALNEVVEQLGAGHAWSIQDGQLLILAPSATTSDEGVLLTPTSGLVGEPQRQQKGVEVVSLLQPSIKPGRTLRVESESLTGYYRPSKVVHVGDYRAQDWYSRVEAKEVK